MAAKTNVSRKAGKLFRPEGKFKNHNLLHVNSSTVPSSQIKLVASLTTFSSYHFQTRTFILNVNTAIRKQLSGPGK